MHRLGATPNAWWVSADEVDLSRSRQLTCGIRVEARPQTLRMNLARCALIIVDMQNDFCTPGGWLDFIGVDINEPRRLIPTLADFLPTVRAHQVPVIWVNWGNRPDRLNLSPSVLHVYNPTGQDPGLGDTLPVSQSPVLQKGSWGAAVVDELTPHEADIRVDKYRMSGFWDTPLDSILRNLDVTTLWFAGVNADQCVMATLQGANFLGYDCVFLEDCSATTSPAYCWDATVYNVKQCYGFVTSSADIIQGISDAGF